MQDRTPRAGLPHARGGVSDGGELSRARTESSPRTWGCFQGGRRCCRFSPVFPTHVGVFLMLPLFLYAGTSLPHARGGVSHRVQSSAMRHGSSPRTWGCFHESEGERRELGVFPTHVGVFPMIRSGFPPEVCLPHARGGVSSKDCIYAGSCLSSPRTWGCFSRKA